MKSLVMLVAVLTTAGINADAQPAPFGEAKGLVANVKTHTKRIAKHSAQERAAQQRQSKALCDLVTEEARLNVGRRHVIFRGGSLPSNVFFVSDTVLGEAKLMFVETKNELPGAQTATHALELERNKAAQEAVLAGEKPALDSQDQLKRKSGEAQITARLQAIGCLLLNQKNEDPVFYWYMSGPDYHQVDQ